MISSRLQQRLLATRCVHAKPLVTTAPSQFRLASSSARSAKPPPQKISTTAAKPVAPTKVSTSPTASAAAERSRQHAQRDARPLELDSEYRARYKSASRRWTASMIALPILLVTSYYLFDRCEFLPARSWAPIA